MNDRLLGSMAFPWGQADPEGHQPLNALRLKSSKERKAKSEERQEVEAGSRSSKTKRQQMNRLPFQEGHPQLHAAGNSSRRLREQDIRSSGELTAAWNQPNDAR